MNLYLLWIEDLFHFLQCDIELMISELQLKQTALTIFSLSALLVVDWVGQLCPQTCKCREEHSSLNWGNKLYHVLYTQREMELTFLIDEMNRDTLKC